MKIKTKITAIFMMCTAISISACDNGGGNSGGDIVPTASNVPANITATAGKEQVTISWNEVPGADSYIVYWDVSPGVTRADEVVLIAAPPYTQTALGNGTTYYYTVSAVVGGEESALSDEVSARPNFTASEIEKIISSDGQEHDNFGRSVSINGNYAVIGADMEDGGSGNPISEAGAAYIFQRADANTWDAGTKITAPDAQAGDNFGSTVAISGDYVIVGALYEDGGTDDPLNDAGAAYIFHRTGENTWDTGVKITAFDAEANDYFGYSVSICGDYAIVGARNDDEEGMNAGAAYIFHRTGVNTWDAGVKITAPDAEVNDSFGYSVSINGNYVIVGAICEDGGSGDPLILAGAAYIFQRTDTNTWSTGTKITAPDAQAEDFFGVSVSISGDYAIVGAIYEDGGNDDPLSDAGAAYIFHRIDANTWDAGFKITATDAQAEDHYGYSVSISGDYTIVGARSEDGGTGDPLTSAGAAYIYHRTGTNEWDTLTRVSASDAAAYDYFGWSVSISGTNIIVGSYYDDDGGINAGAAYFY